MARRLANQDSIKNWMRIFHLMSTSSAKWSSTFNSEPEGSGVEDDGFIYLEGPGVDWEQLHHLMRDFRRDKTIKKLAKKNLLYTDDIFHGAMKSFQEYITSKENLLKNDKLCTTLEQILNGSANNEDLFPFFLSHARSINPLIGSVKKLLESSNLCSPASWFPEARALTRRIIYHAGPTNSGKTHKAIQHFKSARTAIYCAPLRLLAHEIFHRSNKEGVACDLLTGEESQFASKDPLKPAPRLSCTVEMAFSKDTYPYEVGVIDEIQMIADLDRGGAWTKALLGLPAAEIHLCGHECAISLVKKIAATTGDSMEIHHYERLSPLQPSEKTLRGTYSAVKPGDCVVAFSRSKVFEISRVIESTTKQRCAMVYGDLPPAVRVQQADLFNNHESDCNVMVATDAIGLGLNLNIRRVIFYSLMKFDGKAHKLLTPAHARQIAGRAGRYGKKHSKGFVTTFQHEDFTALHDLLKTRIAKIKKAGLYPTLAQIKHFSSHIPKAQLHEILILFRELAELDGSYFLCDIFDQISLAYELRHTSMSLDDMFVFTLAPVDLNKEKVVSALCKFAKCFCEGKKISYSIVCGLLGDPPMPATSDSQLAELEQKYEIVNLYLWLSMRYPMVFMDAEDVYDIQDAIEESIAISLEQKPSLKGALKQKKGGDRRK